MVHTAKIQPLKSATVDKLQIFFKLQLGAIKAYRLRNVLPHVPVIAWGEFSLLWRTRWKPFGSPCVHSFLLKRPYKPTHKCCNMNLFPLFLPIAVPLPIFYFIFYFNFRPFLFEVCIFSNFP